MTTTVGYTTKASLVVTLDGPNFTLLDAMLAAQNAVGQITWTKLTETVARGTYDTHLAPYAKDQRVIAVDLDNADVQDAVAAAIWVNEK